VGAALPHDEPDYGAAVMFTLSEAIRIVGQLRREQRQAREISLAVRFNDFTEVGVSPRFQHPQFLNSVMNSTLEAMFREIMGNAFRPVRQIRIVIE
jgi:nucleotidyltransferase/DNA polymerase involved in DNA repair